MASPTSVRLSLTSLLLPVSFTALQGRPALALLRNQPAATRRRRCAATHCRRRRSLRVQLRVRLSVRQPRVDGGAVRSHGARSTTDAPCGIAPRNTLRRAAQPLNATALARADGRYGVEPLDEDDYVCSDAGSPGGQGTCSDGESCLYYGYNPARGTMSFDSILPACMTIFQCVTLEGWVDVMYTAMEVAGPLSSLYFISLISLGAFYVLNLFLAVLWDTCAPPPWPLPTPWPPPGAPPPTYKLDPQLAPERAPQPGVVSPHPSPPTLALAAPSHARPPQVLRERVRRPSPKGRGSARRVRARGGGEGGVQAELKDPASPLPPPPLPPPPLPPSPRALSCLLELSSVPSRALPCVPVACRHSRWQSNSSRSSGRPRLPR